MKYARFASMIGTIAVIIAILSGPSYAAGKGIEDILYEKGSITKEEWVQAKAEKEELAAKTAPPSGAVSNLLKGIEVKATFYFDFTYAGGDSFTADQLTKGLNPATANNNKSLANGFHFTRTYFTLIKRFDEGHHFRLTLDQMVNNVGGNSCPNGAGSSAGNCHEAAPFGLAGYAGTGRNSTFVKYAYYNHVVLPGLEIRLGQHQTPWIEYEEHRWTYRYQGPIMVDQQNFQTSSDLGVSLLGKVLNNTIDYHFSFMNGEGYQNTPDGRSYAWLGRVSVEPIKGVIISGFGHHETVRNGIENFNPQRLLGNIEFYAPQTDRFKVNAQYVWADDGSDIGTPRSTTGIFVPATYNGSTALTPTLYGARNGPSTSTPRFHNGQGSEFWAYYRIPMLFDEKVRLFSRYYFMKPNKSTTAGDNQSILFGVSYDYSKYLSVALDYTLLKQTVLGSGTVAGQTISSGTAGNGGAGCPTCGRTVDYDNHIFGVKVLVAF
ncbi:MAG TPA: hypothetical protein VGQ07_06380 [Nitrospirales bacterium]|jgi:hypothetical protein|nr:hypothetical protein [Nitrospirales bacterium]